MVSTNHSFEEPRVAVNSLKRRELVMPHVKSVDPRERQHAATTIKFNIPRSVLKMSADKLDDTFQHPP